MDARLTHEMLAQRMAASHAVAGALAPKGTGSNFKSATHAAAAGTGSSSTSAADASSTITSDDFLTLLVSELKNQDPTQPTDPNAYITQLAQVNSLEQLIQINKGITTLDSSVPSTTTTPTKGVVAGLSPSASLQPASATALANQNHKQVPGAAAQ